MIEKIHSMNYFDKVHMLYAFRFFGDWRYDEKMNKLFQLLYDEVET